MSQEYIQCNVGLGLITHAFLLWVFFGFFLGSAN